MTFSSTFQQYLCIIPAVVLTLACGAESTCFGQTLNRVFIQGNAVEDHEKAWQGHIEHIGWLDDETILFQSGPTGIRCWNVRTNREVWSDPKLTTLECWSISRKDRRLAIIEDDPDKTLGVSYVRVFDGMGGKKLFQADSIPRDGLRFGVAMKFPKPEPGSMELKKLLNQEQFILSKLAYLPDGRLLLAEFELAYGPQGYVFKPDLSSVDDVIPLDVAIKELSFASTSAGIRMASLADDDVLCIRDLSQQKDLLLEGRRILERQTSFGGVIDAPFISHVRYDGGRWLVTSKDNSWSTGIVTVKNLDSGEERKFDGLNGHIEMDVDFVHQHIALTGTSSSLVVLKFDGTEIAKVDVAAKQRVTEVEFSPDGKKLLIGSWDNTVSVWELTE